MIKHRGRISMSRKWVAIYTSRSDRAPLIADVAHGRRRGNNLDIIRLFAAALVLASHSFAIAGAHEPFKPHDTLGTVGVEIFFAMSGFLVAKSWINDPSLLRFSAKRALRIVPGLLVALLLTAFALGPFVTNRSLGDYFGSLVPAEYVARNVLMRTFDTLPGIFGQNPLPGAPNGSLWTLPLEVSAYGLVVCFGILRLLDRRVILSGAVALIVALSIFHPLSERERLLSVFLAGAALYANRSFVRLRVDVAFGAFVLWVLLFDTRLAQPASLLLLPYILLTVAYRSPESLGRFASRRDASYGLYIYAWPVQQTVVAMGLSSPWLVIGTATPIALALALASWRLVEEPALRLKPRRHQETAPVLPGVAVT